MITFDHDQRRRESYICGGWNIGTDDDLPHQPECDVLDFAQRRRYLKSAKASRTHRQADCRDVKEQGPIS